MVFLRVMDESPRYLVSKGLLGEAERVLRRAARLNGGTLPSELTATLRRVYQVGFGRYLFCSCMIYSFQYILIS